MTATELRGQETMTNDTWKPVVYSGFFFICIAWPFIDGMNSAGYMSSLINCLYFFAFVTIANLLTKEDDNVAMATRIGLSAGLALVFGLLSIPTVSIAYFVGTLLQ
jgi:hypothetical protein